MADNWPGWRGPSGNGVSGETNLPTRWSDTKGVVWKATVVGSGASSPAIWDERIFLTSADGPRNANLHVLCLSRDTGAELWHRQFWGTAPTLYHEQKGSMATPSPVTDGADIYAFFATGDVFSLDVDGNLNWHRSLASEYGPFENRFGASSSPLVYQDSVILQCDHYGGSYLLAIDKSTGANRWKIDRSEYWLSWASPTLVPIDGGEHFELVVSGSHKLDGFNPASGEKLWTVQGMSRECIPSPVHGNGFIYAVSGPGGASLAIRPGGRGDVTSTHVKWQNSRGAPFVPSAILVGEHYYLVHDEGVGSCLDAQTGKVHWQKRFSGRFTASPVAGDGKVYFTDEAGTTLVIAAEKDSFRQVAQNSVNEPVFSSPAISQGRFFVRTPEHLYCIGGADAAGK